MDRKIGYAALGLGLFVMTPAAFAQGAAGVPAEKGAAGSVTTPHAPSTIQNGRSESLSGKLHASDGVIKPKGDVDPGMATPAPAPHPNSMPVIPPSATGGQNAK